MTRSYLLTRLAKIGATLTEQSKYFLAVTESNGSDHHSRPVTQFISITLHESTEMKRKWLKGLELIRNM